MSLKVVRLLFMRPSDEPPQPPPHSSILVSNIPVAYVVPRHENIRMLVELVSSVDCLLFTSFRGVRVVAERLRGVNLDSVRIGAVGPRTALEVEKLLGVKPSIVPDEYRGVALGRIAARLCKRVVIARSASGLPDIVEVLKTQGVEVVDLPVYEMVYDEKLAKAAASIACLHDYVVFTSPGIAEAFSRAYRGPVCFKVASIGPSTSRRLRELGLPVHVEAERYTIDGIYEAIARREGLI